MKRIPSSFLAARRPVTPLRPKVAAAARFSTPAGAHIAAGAAAPGPRRARDDQLRHEPLVGLVCGPALLYRREEPVDRRGQLLLDLDVAYLPGLVPLGQVSDLGRAVVERGVVGEDRVALDGAGD